MKLLKTLSVLVLGIFLISFASAIVVYGNWEDGSQSIEIENGKDIDFNVDFGSVSLPMIINIKVYDSYDNLVYVFEDETSYNNYYFFDTYTITPEIYGTAGTYEIVILGSDSIKNTDTHTLYLTINPVEEPEPPQNNPPVITSTPITEIDENDFYNYQVTATDTDNGILTFSLTQKPCWLSINSNTGLITGTAPEVTSDEEYQVTVRVSDDEDYDTQTYTLKVKDITQPSQDTTPPVINIINPQNTTYTSHKTQLSYTVSDDVALDSCWYSLDNGITNITVTCAQVITGIQSVNGTNTWTVYANDTSGNIGSASVTFIVEITEEPEPTDDKKGKTAYSYQDVDEIKYFEQFTKPAPISYPKETPEPETPKNWLILILIIGIIGLIIVTSLILISKLKY